MGGAALAALTPIGAPAAQAQQGSPTPTPRPTPAIITLPGANNFDLRPSGAQPTTRPAPPPTVAPTPAPSAAQPPAARATPVPRPAATAASRPAATQPAPAPTPAASPTAQATPLTPPVALATPTPQAAFTGTPTPVPVPEPVAAESGIPWLWILIGAAMASVLVLLGWLLGRRRAEPAPQPVAATPPRPVSPPPAPPAAAPPPPAAPRPIVRPALPLDPIMVELRPIALDVSQNGAVLDFEIALVNATNAAIEDVRIGFGLMSAHENQDAMIAGYHAARLPPAMEPFKLAARAGGRVPGRVALDAAQINVIEVGGRPMFVPLLLIDLRWSTGLSLKHQGTDFMLGVGRQGEKLGPVWLDKGAQRHERLNANRYVARRVAVAAE